MGVIGWPAICVNPEIAVVVVVVVVPMEAVVEVETVEEGMDVLLTEENEAKEAMRKEGGETTSTVCWVRGMSHWAGKTASSDPIGATKRTVVGSM